MFLSARKFPLWIVGLIVCLGVLLPASPADALTVTFDSETVGTKAHEVAIPGVSFYGTPSSYWVIYPGGPDVSGVYSTVTGNILTSSVVAGSRPYSLEVYFDDVHTSVSFKYVGAPAWMPMPSISAVAYFVSDVSWSGFLNFYVPPGGSYWEGEITIPGPVTQLVLSGYGVGFGIDDLVTVPFTPPSGFISDFEAFSVGDPAESIGLFASSPASPGSWTIEQSSGAFVMLDSQFLYSSNCAIPLVFDFAGVTYSEISFNFATDGSAEVKVETWLAGSYVATDSFFGTALGSPSGWYEGLALVTGSTFDRVVVRSNACMGIDYIVGVH